MRKLVVPLLFVFSACSSNATDQALEQGPGRGPQSGPAQAVPAPESVRQARSGQTGDEGAGAAPAAGAAAPGAAAGDTLARIRELIGQASCTEAAQCRVLPIGARPCGGPESYLAWSSAHSSASQLQQLAERYKQQREAYNAANQRISDCRAIAPPLATCRAGQCELADALMER